MEEPIILPNGEYRWMFKTLSGKERAFRDTDDKEFQDAAHKYAMDQGFTRVKNNWVRGMATEYFKDPQAYVEKAIKNNSVANADSNVSTKLLRDPEGNIIPNIGSEEWAAAIEEVEMIEAENSPELIASYLANEDEFRKLMSEWGINDIEIEYIISILKSNYGRQ